MKYRHFNIYNAWGFLIGILLFRYSKRTSKAFPEIAIHYLFAVFQGFWSDIDININEYGSGFTFPFSD